ncbi:MAG: diaminopimelate dehydrogenase [Clostridia bacterium]|nr:diaminopimelate dehydrogenase [Clostridia bacterium]
MNIGIYGYGNLGKGVELSVASSKDMNLIGVFTRRNPSEVKTLLNTPVYSADDLLNFKDEIDVLIICGGSATDLPTMTPSLAKDFNVVDSFDTHSNIPLHYKNVDEVATKNDTIALISGGWDPGMFSVARLYAESILPNGKTYTFWGKGISQGHSDAIRRIDGVLDARQYTIPNEEAINLVKDFKEPDLTTREKHFRECFVVVKDGADKSRIESEIVNMPNYFKDYNTIVHFISKEELLLNHSGMPHGGSVIRSGKTGINNKNNHSIEYSLKLDSNPEFTASVLTCLARAIYKMKLNGDKGCKTIFDIPPKYLSTASYEELIGNLL